MRYFSTFSGIGGFELGIHNAHLKHAQYRSETEPTEPDKNLRQVREWETVPKVSRGSRRVGPVDESQLQLHFGDGTAPFCVGYSEIDRYAVSVYEKHFKGVRNYGDITKIIAEELPDFDCLVGGFPCQAFSIAGKRGGFNDTRGTLFFDLARILRAKQPRLFVFENVKGLLSHDDGKTFRTIITAIDELGYDAQWQVVNSKNFGVPQNRERIIIVGHLRGTPRPQVFPFVGGDGETFGLPGQQNIANTLTTRYTATGTGTYVTERELDAQKKIKVVGTLDTDGWEKRNESIRRVYDPDGLAPTIPTGTGGGVMPKVLVPQGRKYVDGKRIIKHEESDTVPTIRATHYKSGDNQPKIAVPVLTPDRAEKRQNGRRFKTDGEPSFTLTSQDKHGIYDGVKVRRLTPLECERLQAFPDYWTKYDSSGNEISDSQRYKMCGNAVTTNVIQAIFERIFRSYE